MIRRGRGLSKHLCRSLITGRRRFRHFFIKFLPIDDCMITRKLEAIMSCRTVTLVKIRKKETFSKFNGIGLARHFKNENRDQIKLSNGRTRGETLGGGGSLGRNRERTISSLLAEYEILSSICYEKYSEKWISCLLSIEQMRANIVFPRDNLCDYYQQKEHLTVKLFDYNS